MKKVVFIGKWLNDKNAAGINRYTLEILKELDKIVHPNEVELLIPSSETVGYEFENIKILHMGKAHSSFGTFGKRIDGYLYKNYYAKKYIEKEKAISVDTLLQFPLFGCDVIAVFDCRVNKYPEFYDYSAEQRRIRKVMLRHQNKAVKNCKCIVTDSQTIRNELLEEYKGYNKPIYVTYTGWQHFSNVLEDTTVLEKLGIQPQKFFFSLGSRLPHKNARWISYAAKLYPQYKFVVTGKSMGNGDFEGEKSSNIIFSGRLSDEEIKALMHYCKAFIQPSLYEGFGMPPLEAMSVGADCMISDIPVFREIYENSVWYFDPTDYEHIDLDKIMSSPKDNNELILNKYSWKNSAERLWEALKKEREN